MLTVTIADTAPKTAPVDAGAPIFAPVAVDPFTPQSPSCYVLGCRETVVYENGSKKVFRHRRFGSVYACTSHDPTRG